MITALAGLAVLAVLSSWAIHMARRVAQARNQLNADIAFMQAIPGGVEQ